VALEYAGGDKLYVPVENIDVLSRYGSDNEGVGARPAGRRGWQRRKARLKERIREIAHELLKVAPRARCARLRVAGRMQAGYRPVLSTASPMTRPRIRSAPSSDVLEDLAAGRPMDRLVCGDVGFGKTEVALRAAFVAAMAGHAGGRHLPHHPARPPALIPQFRRALRGFPAEGRPPLAPGPRQAEAAEDQGGAGRRHHRHRHRHPRAAVQGHRFKRLGLVIVDEEQRFGVVHKERLKQLRPTCMC
jgi:transcription-repair coupling factor (superfamily II helicase)